jgi:hypothetical protein
MKANMIRALAGLAVLMFSASNVMADSASCIGSTCAAGPLSVTFSVTIPGFVRFELGASGSNPDVQFNTGVTAANIGTGSVSADTVVNGGAGANGTDQVRYAVLSNLGGTNVSVSAAGSGAGLLSGANTIPYSEIGSTTTVTTGSGVAMPAAGGSTAIAFPGSGIINEVGYWNYTFGNSAVYPSGTYTGTITYTATHTP